MDLATADLALLGGTIYPAPGEAPIHDGLVLIRDGKIAAVGPRRQLAIPQGAQALDCSGLSVLAGFWNCHVHFFERKWADAGEIPTPELTRQLEDFLTRYGFTSAFDLSSPWENTRRLRERIESGDVSGPRIRSTGEGLLPAGALSPEIVSAMMGIIKTALNEVSEAAQATAAVQKLVSQGVDAIKLFASGARGARLSESVMQTAISEAHRAAKLVFVHPNNATDVLEAVKAGADIVAHTTPSSGPWDSAVLGAMRQRGTALIPTLWIWKYYARHDRASSQDKTVDAELAQLRAFLAEGGVVLFGTDLGAVDPDPTEEYALMSQAGMSFPRILASLTTAPAERFGQSSRLGRVATGLSADLVLLQGDPGQDLRALTEVRYTLRDGKIIYR
jgi:imidazolonepropionase-like amidohydrolase